MGLAPGQNDRNAELPVHRQQVGGRVSRDRATELRDGSFGLADDFRVQLAQELVDLQELVVPIGGEAHRLIGPDQAAEAVDVSGGRRHPFGLIDDQTRQKATMLVQVAQFFDQLLAAEPVRPGPDDALSHVEHLRRHDRLEGAFLLDPHVWLVRDPVFLEFERDPVVDVVADVLFVGQHLADSGPGPIPVQVGTNSLAIESGRDFRLRYAAIDEPLVDLVDRLHLGVGAWHQDHPIRLQAFVLSTSQLTFDGATLVDQDAAQAVTGRATLAVPQFDQAALPGKHLGGQFPAVLARHCTFDTFDDGGNR